MMYEPSSPSYYGMSTGALRMSNKMLHGIVHGKTIEVSEDPGVPLGQIVDVLLMPSTSTGRIWGDGLRRCAGALAGDWTDEDDRILDVIQQERNNDGRPELSE
jgi:hypothetical protein